MITVLLCELIDKKNCKNNFKSVKVKMSKMYYLDYKQEVGIVAWQIIIGLK